MTLDQFDNLTIAEIGANWPDLRAMVADNERLRALVKDSEWSYGEHGECLWCSDNRPLHAPDCPGFTPDGVVK